MVQYSVAQAAYYKQRERGAGHLYYFSVLAISDNVQHDLQRRSLINIPKEENHQNKGNLL